MQVIDQINGSALFAQSAYSAAVATNDDLGRKISTTYLTAVDLSEYATETLVEETSGAITSLIPTDYYPDTNPSSFATEDWVTGQGYITGVNIPESATWNDVSTTVQTNSAQWSQGGGGGDAEVNSFVYENSATINEVNSAYQTNSASYLTEFGDTEEVEFEEIDLSSFASSSQINELSAAIDYVSANAGDDFPSSADEAVQYVQTNSATINNVNTSYKTNSGSFLTTADSANFYPANNPSGFITGVDLSNYYTKDETSGKEELSNAFANVPTPDYEVESYIHNNSASIDGTSTVVQSNSSTWSDVTAYQSNSANYITAHQSLDGYATTAWVDEQGYLTEVSIPESATWNEVSTTVQTNSSVWDNVTNKLDTTSFSDVSGTFLTAHQDLSDYYTTAEAETLSSMFSGAIDYVSANAGDEFPVSADEAIQYVQTNSANIDETVTAYQTNSGDYLKESELGYNAVDEVSAINGSAIAQYGAEKQWLVHDDTLVHAANSAQYALGVNLSAVAQLLGVDETVLFSGNVNTNNGYLFNLPEPITNFKSVKVYAADVRGWTESIFEFDPNYIGSENRWSHCLDLTFNTRGALVSTGTVYFRGIMLTANEASVNSAIQISAYGYENNEKADCSIQKIVGIGRKQ